MSQLREGQKGTFTMVFREFIQSVRRVVRHGLPCLTRRGRRCRMFGEVLEVRAMLSAALAVHENYSGPVDFGYTQTNLVSNIPGFGFYTDPRLVNPWDVNFPQKPDVYPPVFVADQGTGVVTSYKITDNGRNVIESKSAVTINEPSGPTGLVQNTPPIDFLIPRPHRKKPVPATYIVDTLQGTIEGIEGFSVKGNITNATSAVIMVNNSSAGAEYTGLAAGTFNGKPYLYAANEGTNPGIQVFDGSFHQVPLGISNFSGSFIGNFIDPILPAGFLPYGVRDLSLGTHQEHYLYVTYRGPNFQGGAVAVFTNNGEFLGQIASDTKSGGNLQSPWGLAFIKQGLFGAFGGDLLVGNFSSGQIDAYKVTVNQSEARAKFQGWIPDEDGLAPLTIPGLRSIHFGPGLGDSGKPHVALLFTAELDRLQSGIGRNLSLYGEITPNGPVTIYHGNGGSND
jgi:uncharacterized protein (TIGR03118 family)